MSEFMTKHLPMAPDAVAPDGSEVRLLLRLDGGGMAHFELAPERVVVFVAPGDADHGKRVRQ